MDLHTNVRYLKGIGEARAKKLEKLGITDLQSLLRYYPRRYEDRTVFTDLGNLEEGASVCVRVTVATSPTLSRIRQGVELVRFEVADEHGKMPVVFFNRSYLKNAVSLGDELVLFGRVTRNNRRLEMINPIMEPEQSAGKVTGRLMPVYSLTAGIGQGQMVQIMENALTLCGEELPDVLPDAVRRKYTLAQARYTFWNIHFPKTAQDAALARDRLVFEELFVLSCALSQLRRTRKKEKCDPIPLDTIPEFTDRLPFSLTGAQRRAIEQCAGDMAGSVPMSRLVQGDVGSGKTVVAAACCYLAAKAGKQAAVMAPTEILARQHYKTFSELLTPLGLRVGLLTGGMTAKEQRQTRAMAESGELDVVVGTHSLVSDGTAFRSLSLAVVDEQHRFGVQQRAVLSRKGESPHVLVMSATPIPRTLSLILYGDLDVSVIDELPPGRTPVETYAVSDDMRPRIHAFIRKQVEAGRQVYVVCPAVEEEDTGLGLRSATQVAETLQNEIFPDLRVMLVHGKMKPKEKDAVMKEFSEGRGDILVSTTVIEVGVDVPNASLMVVENADRFGLSQLHQLRGRVGRGQYQSYCVLFSGSGGETAMKRLKVLCRTNDGFQIAEEDLKLRGPGDFFGSRQSGLPELEIADLTGNPDILQEARNAAQELLEKDPALSLPEHENLKNAVQAMLARNDGTIS